MYEEIDEALQNKEWDKAISIIKTNFVIDNNKDLLEKLGWACSRIENYKEAIDCFKKLIVLEPNMAKWHYMVGYQFYMQKNWKEAIEEFVKALELYPNYFIVKYRLAYAYIQVSGTYLQYTKDTFWKALGQLKECHQIYNESSQEFKDNEKNTYFDICFLHGKTIQELNGKQNEAIELLKTALSIKSDENCQYQLAKTYFIMKDYDNVLKYLPQSNKYYVKELEANTFSDMGKISESNSILFQLIKHRKKDYLYYKLSENFAHEGKIDKAIEFVNKAIEIGKDNYKNYLLLGELQIKNRKYRSAINSLSKANDFKLKKFNLACPEANEKIIEILSNSNNNPCDEDEEKRIGEIIDYNITRGFGFIHDKEFGKVFFHISDIINFGSKEIKNKSVIYNLQKTDKGYKAINIRIKNED